MAKLKNHKKIAKLINNMVVESFSRSGELLEPKVTNFSKTLKSFSPSAAIWLLTGYLAGLKRELKKNILTIETPLDLSKAEIDKAAASFGTGRAVTVQTVLNPSLLGGLRLKIGDMVWDDSVESKIDQIKEVVAYG